MSVLPYSLKVIKHIYAYFAPESTFTGGIRNVTDLLGHTMAAQSRPGELAIRWRVSTMKGAAGQLHIDIIGIILLKWMALPPMGD